MRYGITSWVEGADEPHQMWKTWGRRRAQKTADEIIAGYRQRGLIEFEVMIFAQKDNEVRWYFSADRQTEVINQYRAAAEHLRINKPALYQGILSQADGSAEEPSLLDPDALVAIHLFEVWDGGVVGGS